MKPKDEEWFTQAEFADMKACNTPGEKKHLLQSSRHYCDYIYDLVAKFDYLYADQGQDIEDFVEDYLQDVLDVDDSKTSAPVRPGATTATGKQWMACRHKWKSMIFYGYFTENTSIEK